MLSSGSSTILWVFGFRRTTHCIALTQDTFEQIALVAEMRSSVLQCLEPEPTKCLCVRLILRAKNDATSSLLNALKLFGLANSDIAMPDRSSVLVYWPDVTHVHRNKVVCRNSKRLRRDSKYIYYTICNL